MFNQLRQVLEEWEKDPEIKLVILESDSDKAFCAGGDVKSVVQESLKEETSFSQNFFLAEYGLDYYLHCYSKPILCWAHGITMGGGIGLFAGCSHKVATENSVFAMPEVSIGFFPDVGGGYFLNRLPQGVGLFLGLTGAHFYGGDAVAMGMADFLIKNEDRQKVVDCLAQVKWAEAKGENLRRLTKALHSFRLHEIQSNLALPLTEVGQQMALLNTFEQVHQFLLEADLGSSSLKKACRAYRGSSPFVARVIFEHIKRCKGLSLAEVFALEWDLAIRFCHEPEFYEGVRALLIDKDQSPRWRVRAVGEISQQEVDKILSPLEHNLLEPQLTQRRSTT